MLRDPVGLAAREAEDVRGRVGGLCAGRDVARPALQRVLGSRVIDAQADQARGDFRAEVPRGGDACCANLCGEETGRGKQPERAHELGVELGDRHGRGRVGGHRRLLPGQSGDEVAEVTCGERVVRPEAARLAAHQPVRGDELDLRQRP